MRRKLNLKQKDLAELTGRTTSAVGYWETGKSIIPTEVVAKLIEVYRVNPLWLLVGEGPMFLDDSLSVSGSEEELKKQEVFEVMGEIEMNLEALIGDLIEGSKHYAKGSEHFTKVGIRLRKILEKIREKE